MARDAARRREMPDRVIGAEQVRVAVDDVEGAHRLAPCEPAGPAAGALRALGGMGGARTPPSVDVGPVARGRLVRVRSAERHRVSIASAPASVGSGRRAPACRRDARRAAAAPRRRASARGSDRPARRRPSATARRGERAPRGRRPSSRSAPSGRRSRARAAAPGRGTPRRPVRPGRTSRGGVRASPSPAPAPSGARTPHLLEAPRQRRSRTRTRGAPRPSRRRPAPVAQYEARARERSGAPRVAPFPVVALRGRQARREPAALAAGAQPQVDGERDAGGGDVAERAARRSTAAL